MSGYLFVPAVLLAVVSSMCGIVSALVEHREAARRRAAAVPVRRPFRPVVVAGNRVIAPAHFRAARSPLRSSEGTAINDNAGRATFG